MITSYRDRDTEALALGEVVRRWEPFRKQAEKRLRVLDAARSVGELAALNSNRLESLKGDRKGQFFWGTADDLAANRFLPHLEPCPARPVRSIRTNDQWRICFEWPKDGLGSENVEIVDYH